MNTFQLAVLAGAAVNLVVALLLPPFDSYPLGRGMATFDAFYPIFAAPITGAVNTGLLYIEIMAISFNAALAWLLLQDGPQGPRTRWQSVLQWLVIADLLLVLLFPPFETRALSSMGVNSFDGFRFALTGNIHQGIFLPLLLLELLVLALNAAVYWLVFGFLSRGEPAGVVRAAPAIQSPERAAAPVPAQKAQGDAGAAQFGRVKRERRVRQDPAYKGPERRKGADRRHITQARRP